MLNSVDLIGNLGQDPVLRYTNATSKPVVNITLAVHRGKDDGATWIPVTVWGEAAKSLAEYKKSGDEILVHDAYLSTKERPRTDNPADGTLSILNVEANRVTFLRTAAKNRDAETIQATPDAGSAPAEADEVDFDEANEQLVQGNVLDDLDGYTAPEDFDPMASHSFVKSS